MFSDLGLAEVMQKASVAVRHHSFQMMVRIWSPHAMTKLTKLVFSCS